MRTTRSPEDFFREQQDKLRALKEPPVRLHDDPVFDEPPHSTERRHIHLDGGQDELHRQQCREVMEQIVLGAQVPVPLGWTPFEAAARAVLTLAADVDRLHRSQITTRVKDHATREAESRQIDDFVEMALFWCERLLTQGMERSPAEMSDSRVDGMGYENTSVDQFGTHEEPDATIDQRPQAAVDMAVPGVPVEQKAGNQDREHQPSHVANGRRVADEWVFRPTEHGWELGCPGAARIQILERLRGFDLIWTLLENPNCQISATALMSDVAATPAVAISPREITDSGGTVTHGFAGIKSYDPQMRKQLIERIRQLKADQEEARCSGSAEKADTCQEEIEKLEDFLVENTNHKGRARMIGADREHARKTALAQVTRALQKLEKLMPALAEHLRDHVDTGRELIYRPPATIEWVTR